MEIYDGVFSPFEPHQRAHSPQLIAGFFNLVKVLRLLFHNPV